MQLSTFYSVYLFQSDIDITANLTEHFKANNLDHIVTLVTPPERLGLIR